MSEWPPCDTCGQPATIIAQDMIEIENWTTGWMEYEPAGVRRGCDEHPVESRILARRTWRHV